MNEIDIKMSKISKTEALIVDDQISLMNVDYYKLNIQVWFNSIYTYKQVMKSVFSIACEQCANTMKQKLDTFPVFYPIKDKQYHNFFILVLDLIKTTCYTF